MKRLCEIGAESSAAIAAILLVDRATGVAVTDLTIDGFAAAFNACSPGYVGIFFRASSGAIEDTHVTNIHHPLASGCQAVLGIFVQSGNGGPGLNSNVAILNNMVDEYGKNGITANEASARRQSVAIMSAPIAISVKRSPRPATTPDVNSSFNDSTS